MRYRNGWIFSPVDDTWSFAGAVALSWLIVLAAWLLKIPANTTPMWMLGVILVDGSHVWSTFYRTYLDREEFRQRVGLYLAIPLLSFLICLTLTYAAPMIWFWRFLSYSAAYHFLRQQFGFVSIAARRAGENPRQFLFDKIAIYTLAGYPMIWMHCYGKYAWFMPGDFFRLPPIVADVAAVFFWLVVATYFPYQLYLGIRGSGLNLPKLYITLGTFATWYLGIVVANASPLAFYWNLVLIHGIPYYLLMYRYGRGRWSTCGDGGWVSKLFTTRSGWVGFYLLPVSVSTLWVLLRHLPAGYMEVNAVKEFQNHFLISFWAVAQLSHYYLDAFIWRHNRYNPNIGRYVSFEPAAIPKNVGLA